MRFFVGLHQPSDAHRFDAAFVSVNRLRNRKSDFAVGDWIMDSGAFTEISTHGRYRHDVSEYANQIRRWKSCGNLIAAVSQDYMCEPFILRITGMTVADHQRMTVERYDALLAEDTGVYIMPVLQGFAPSDYVQHIAMYGDRLAIGAYVGVGSVCKRNGSPKSIMAVLYGIRSVRPDLRLHGFGLKKTSLELADIANQLESADSMAWSFAARKAGRSPNHWSEAAAFVRHMDSVIGSVAGPDHPSFFD
jgi:hypothetical protein